MNAREKILAYAQERKIFRSSDLERATGLSRMYISRLVKEGQLERLGHGLYSLAGSDFTEQQSIMEVAAIDMKYIFSLIIIIGSALLANGQFKPTSQADYKGTFSYAVGETNQAFPFVFTVTTEFYKGGKLVETHKEVHERQAPGVERLVKTFDKEGKTTRKYRTSTGFGQVYCSDDGEKWIGPQKFECFGPSSFYGPRTPESTEYSVSTKKLGGQEVKVFREYIVYSARAEGGKKEFWENRATIDLRGFFVDFSTEEGTLDPRTVNLVRKQTWKTHAKFEPVAAPVK